MLESTEDNDAHLKFDNKLMTLEDSPQPQLVGLVSNKSPILFALRVEGDGRVGQHAHGDMDKELIETTKASMTASECNNLASSSEPTLMNNANNSRSLAMETS